MQTMRRRLTEQYGLSPLHLLMCVIRPVLYIMGKGGPVAEVLVLGTAMCESKLRYLDQLDARGLPGRPGPAYGIYQCEHLTHRDYWERCFSKDDGLRAIANRVSGAVIQDLCPAPEMLQWSLAYATLCCRVHYLLVKAPLPRLHPREMALYYKQYYNTFEGKATIEKSEVVFADALYVLSEAA